jgi:hypothetical protein
MTLLPWTNVVVVVVAVVIDVDRFGAVVLAVVGGDVAVPGGNVVEAGWAPALPEPGECARHVAAPAWPAWRASDRYGAADPVVRSPSPAATPVKATAVSSTTHRAGALGRGRSRPDRWTGSTRLAKPWQRT